MIKVIIMAKLILGSKNSALQCFKKVFNLIESWYQDSWYISFFGDENELAILESGFNLKFIMLT